MLNKIIGIPPEHVTFDREVAEEVMESYEPDGDIYFSKSIDNQPLADDQIPKVSKKEFDNWAVNGSNYIANSTPNVTVKHIPPGRYSVRQNDKIGIYLQKAESETDQLLNLPFKEYDGVLSDIDTFWKQEKKYKEYNYLHKRGILLHGPAGSGKSSLVHLIAKNVVDKYNGLVFYVSNDYELELTSEVFHHILVELEPNRKKVLIIEDIDNFCKGRSIESKLLGLLDGNATMTSTLTIATTNYPENLPDRIKNRPSRFDTVKPIGFPDETVRRFYLENKIKKNDLKKIDIDQWVSDTDRFTISHLKELITSVVVIGKTYESALEGIRSLADNITSRDYEQNRKAGFRN